MTLNLIPILILSGLSGLGAWVFQDARHGAAMSEYRAEVMAEREAESARVRKVEGDWNVKYQTAVNSARDRERTLRADLVAVRDAAASVRTQAAEAASRLAQAPAPAVLEYANTLGDVFAECSARYGEVAQAADGHASDARAILEAWPVNQE